MCNGSVGRAAEAARHQRGNSGQCSGGVGSARAAKAVQWWHWMRRRQLGGGRQQRGRAAAAAVRVQVWETIFVILVPVDLSCYIFGRRWVGCRCGHESGDERTRGRHDERTSERRDGRQRNNQPEQEDERAAR
jgi:hypothetical protein